jgi:hypothetical protein
LAVEWLAIKRCWAEDSKQLKAVGKLSKLCWITLSNAIKEYHERITGEEHTPDGVFSLANFDELFGKAENGSWREVLFGGVAHGTDVRKQQDILLSLAPLPLQDYPLMADFLLFLWENNRRANRPNLIHLYSSKAIPSTAGIANLTLETVAQITEGVVRDNTPSQRLKTLWKGSFNPPSVQQTRMLLVRCLMVESMQQKALEGLEQPRSPLAAATRTASPLLEPQPTTHQSQSRDPGAPLHLLEYKKRIVRDYLTRSSLPPSPRESPPVEHVEDSVEAEGMASRSPSPDIRTQGTKRARDGTPMPTALHADRDETPCENANVEEWVKYNRPPPQIQGLDSGSTACRTTLSAARHHTRLEVNPLFTVTNQDTLVSNSPLVAGSLLTVADYLHIRTPQVRWIPLVAQPNLHTSVIDLPLVAQPLSPAVDFDLVLGLETSASKIVHPADRHHSAPQIYYTHTANDPPLVAELLSTVIDSEQILVLDSAASRVALFAVRNYTRQEVNPLPAKKTHGTLVSNPPLVAGSLLTVADYSHTHTPQVRWIALMANPKLDTLVNDPTLVAEPLLTIVDGVQIIGRDSSASRIVHPAARRHFAPQTFYLHPVNDPPLVAEPLPTVIDSEEILISPLAVRPHTRQEVNPPYIKTTHGTLVSNPPLAAGSLLAVADYSHTRTPVRRISLIAQPKLDTLVNDPPLVAVPLSTVVDLDQIRGLGTSAGRIVHPAARRHPAPQIYYPHTVNNMPLVAELLPTVIDSGQILGLDSTASRITHIRTVRHHTGRAEMLGQVMAHTHTPERHQTPSVERKTVKPPHKSPTEERAHNAKHKPTKGELGTVCRYGMSETGPGTAPVPAKMTHGTLIKDPPLVAGPSLLTTFDYAHGPDRNRPAKARRTA